MATTPSEAARAISEQIALRDRLPSLKSRRRLRKAKGCTLDELAKAIGVTKQTISNYETGHREPRGPYLAAYLAVLDELRGLGK